MAEHTQVEVLRGHLGCSIAKHLLRPPTLSGVQECIQARSRAEGALRHRASFYSPFMFFWLVLYGNWEKGWT